MLGILKAVSQGLEWLAAALFIMAVLGLINPRITFRFWKLQTRKTVVTFYMALALLVGGLSQSAFDASLTTEERLEIERQAELREQESIQREAERRAKEIAPLLEEARALPASAYSANLDAYSKLLKLDPGNEEYEAKVAHYRGALDAQLEQARLETEARALEEQRIAAEQREEQARREAKFGPQPVQSGWDNAVPIVKRYLKSIANDPDSIKYERWGALQYSETDGWIVTCDWRARNGLGGYVRQINTFVIRHERVVEMR